jgi:hypothetical protein
LIPIPDAQAADCVGLDSIPERIISFMVVSFYCTILHGVVCVCDRLGTNWIEQENMHVALLISLLSASRIVGDDGRDGDCAEN